MLIHVPNLVPFIVLTTQIHFGNFDFCFVLRLKLIKEQHTEIQE